TATDAVVAVEQLAGHAFRALIPLLTSFADTLLQLGPACGNLLSFGSLALEQLLAPRIVSGDTLPDRVQPAVEVLELGLLVREDAAGHLDLRLRGGRVAHALDLIELCHVSLVQATVLREPKRECLAPFLFRVRFLPGALRRPALGFERPIELAF